MVSGQYGQVLCGQQWQSPCGWWSVRADSLWLVVSKGSLPVVSVQQWQAPYGWWSVKTDSM